MVGPQDWSNKIGQPIPESCCIDVSNCPSRSGREIFQEGCFTAIVQKLEGVTVALGVAAIILAVVQVSVLLSCVSTLYFLPKPNEGLILQLF